MSNVWFTSDTHFGHANIVRACSNWSDPEKCRDFTSIEDHDNYLIEQLNKKVKPTDTLYHLGDFGLGFAWKDRIFKLRERIKCERIKLIFGNHDHLIENAYRTFKETLVKAPDGNLNLKQIEAKQIVNLFDGMDYMKFGKIGGHAMCLCHYAMRIWPWSHHGSYMLYGHSHSSLPDDPNSKSIDVGMDTCLFGHEKYTPYSFEEVDHIMKTCKQFVPVDHHSDKTT